MLLALVDRRGKGAITSQLFERATQMHGAPIRYAQTPHGFVAGWGQSVEVMGPNALSEGAVVSAIPNENVGTPLDFAASARGDFASIGMEGDNLVLTSGPSGGYRPLYIAKMGLDAILASTSLQLVRDWLGERSKLDLDAFAGYVAALTMFSDTAKPVAASLYSDIQRLPMHEAWQIDVAGHRRVMSTFRSIDARHDEADETGQRVIVLKNAFRASVRRAMSGHKRVGILVSGGVDSSGLLAVVRDLVRAGEVSAEIEAFSFTYPTEHGDDRPYLASLAKYLGIEPHAISARDAGAYVGKTFVCDGAPCHSAAAPWMMALGPRVREMGITLLLSGNGGDEVINGEPGLLADVARRRPWRALASALTMRGAMPGGPLWRVNQYVLRPLLRPLLKASMRRARYEQLLRERYPWAGPRLRRYFNEVTGSPPDPPSLDALSDERFAAIARGPLLQQVRVDRPQFEELLGCPRRDPFLDDEFLRQVARLPPLSLMQGGYLRGLFRETLRGLVPDDVRMRRTKAMFEPACYQAVSASGGFDVLRPLADVRRLADLGMAEPRAFRLSFEELTRRPEDGKWALLWPALAAEGFLRQEQARLELP